MPIDLKKILIRATKDFNLELKKEQQMLSSLAQSEEWFMQTYEKLKIIAGKLLTQVDFKDYIQLATVIYQEKDVEQLIKCSFPSEQLIGAARNLWVSLSGVKWLLELRKLVNSSTTSTIDLKSVLDLDDRSKVLNIDYDQEINKNNVYQDIFKDFKSIVETIKSFQNKFGDKKKTCQTLDDLYEQSLLLDDNQADQKYIEFEQEVQNLLEQIKTFNLTCSGNELEVQQKLHYWVQFLRDYIQLAKKYQNNLPQDQAMLLSQQARDQGLPEEINVLRELRERVNRFEKFNREFHDYIRFRDRIKKQGFSLTSGLVDVRFTNLFLQKLLEESKVLQIPKDPADDFNEEIIIDDIKSYEEWRISAEKLFKILQEDDQALYQAENRELFNTLKNQMKQLPVYDKSLFLKVQVFDWLIGCIDIMEVKEGKEPSSIGTWENKIKQAEQYLNVMKELKSHPIYQRMLWEIEQSRQVIDFVNLQKNNQKALAAKFNLDKQQNYAFFRNKHPKQKIQKILDQAKSCKVDLIEEIRCLDLWIRDFDKYTQLYKEDKLLDEYQFDRLRDITKQLYLSPLDYGEIYFSLKEKIDTAEMIKLNLKKIFQEHESANQLRERDNQKLRRLKLSRISYDLKLYKKQCSIRGIKEVDLAYQKVRQSKQKLSEIRQLLADVTIDLQGEESINILEVKQKIDQAKKKMQEIEIDLDEEELEARREIFEAELRLLLKKQTRRILYEEYKSYDQTYEKLRNYMKDEEILAKFLELREKANSIAREINKIENKQDLDAIAAKAQEDCSLIDFTQLLTDKDAKILLGKRNIRTSKKAKQESEQEDEEQPLTITTKRQKLQDLNSQDSQAANLLEQPSDKSKISSSSSDGGSSGSGSSSGSSSSSSSGSDSDSSSSSGDESSSNEEESKEINIAKNRSRRNIVPNMDSDFIYDRPPIKPSQNKNKDKQEVEESKEEQEDDDQKETEEEKQKKKEARKKQKKLLKKKKREQKRKEKEKKKQMERQLKEYRLQQNKTSSTIQSRQNLANRLETDQPFSFSNQVSYDKGLQDSLKLIKNRIRDQSRLKFKEAIEQTAPIFQSLSPEQKKAFIMELESEIFKKHPEVDHYYRKKAQDACENIKFLAGFKDIQDLIALKKSIKVVKLLQPHHQFKDNMINIDKGIKEKRHQLRQQQRQLMRQGQKEEKVQEEQEITVPNEQQMMRVLYSGSSQQIDNQGKEESADPLKNIKVSGSDAEEDDDLESLDSNPALFSDDEQQQSQPNQNFQAENQSFAYDPYQTKTPQQIYQNQQQYSRVGGVGGGYQNYQQMNMPQQQQQIVYRQVPYNPFEVLELKYSRQGQRKQAEPILYDPQKDRLQKDTQNKEKNVAPPGSLLKVWEGLLELSKDSQPSCQFFSTQGIAIYQGLPELPNILTLKGKAKIQDVSSHFLRLRMDKKLIKGWITRRGIIGELNNQVSAGANYWQENFDKYTKLFDELEITQKAALFNVFQGVTLYIVPITASTKEFCHQMGIIPEFLTQGSSDLEKSIQEETHCFAVLSQIKQQFVKQDQFMLLNLQFYSKLNFLNPEVLRLAEVSQQPKPQEQKKAAAQQQNFSPITSDEEDAIPMHQHKQQILQSVKTEELLVQSLNQQQVSHNQRLIDPQGFHHQQNNPPLVKQDEDVQMHDQTQMIANQAFPPVQVKKAEEEDDDDTYLDEIMNKFRRNEYDIQQIQDKLMPIIHKVSGEKEQKLSQFLEEIIRSFNSQQAQQQQQLQVKQESYVGTNQPLYNQGLIPQQQQQYSQVPPQTNRFASQISNQRYPAQQQMLPQGQYINQQNQSQQFRHINTQQQPFMNQPITQQQIGHPHQQMPSAIYGNQQFAPQTIVTPMQQPGQPQFQMRQQQTPLSYNQNIIAGQQQLYQQPQQLGVPSLRPPPPNNFVPQLGQMQMMRPQLGQGLVQQQPIQQYGGNMQPRMIAPQQQQFQQQQQIRPNQGQQQKR